MHLFVYLCKCVYLRVYVYMCVCVYVGVCSRVCMSVIDTTAFTTWAFVLKWFLILHAKPDTTQGHLVGQHIPPISVTQYTYSRKLITEN